MNNVSITINYRCDPLFP